jgi:subtilisin family serine protease/uncharacterized protein (UPF0333 family)
MSTDQRVLTLMMQSNSEVPVLVKLRQNTSTERVSVLKDDKNLIQYAKQQLLKSPSLSRAKAIKTFKTIPFMALHVDSKMLLELQQSDWVESIQLDKANTPSLSESTEFIQASAVWEQGFSGEGQAVAILDTGVDNQHGFFSNKVVSEACYSTNVPHLEGESLCANAANSDTGVDAGRQCSGVRGCDHGTHVAGIAAGFGVDFSGVARGADIIAIQVFTKFDSSTYCGARRPCVRAFDSDIIEGLERVYELRDSYNVASVNLSLGGGSFSSAAECDSANPAYVSIVEKLNEVGIAVVAASGNGSKKNAMNSPACLSGVLSVGAVNNSNQVQSFTNAANFLDLLAPGSGILSATPNENFGRKNGTSMATPHVAGALAVLKSAAPNASTQDIIQSLKDSGIPTSAKGHIVPSINVRSSYEQLTGTRLEQGDTFIKISVDNSEEVYFNGELLGGNSQWNIASEFGVNLQPGRNVFAIKAKDVDGIAALIAELDIQGLIEVSGAHWRVSTVEESGWENPMFDDSAWDFATTYGSYGVAPWQTRVIGLNQATDAQWIWSSDNENDNVVYFRFVIDNGTAPEQPIITTTTFDIGQVGVFYSQMLNGTEGAEPYLWNVVEGQLPGGLFLSKTGEISGIPLSAGTSEFTIQLFDSNSVAVRAAVSITIEDLPEVNVNAEILITVDNSEDVYFNGERLGSSHEWTRGSLYFVDLKPGTNVLAIKAKDEDGIAALLAEINIGGLTEVSGTHWRVSTQEHSDWLDPNYDDSEWAFASSYGEYGVAPWGTLVRGFSSSSKAQWIWSADNEADNTVYFRLVIENGAPTARPTITSNALPTGVVGQPYSAALLAENGTAPYFWEIVSGSLPEGLRLSNQGLITGTTAEIGQRGVTVQVTDDDGLQDSIALTVIVEDEQKESASAEIVLSVDNSEEVYFNGEYLGESSEWNDSSRYTISLQPGINVFAVKAKDVDGVAALIAELNIQGRVEVSDTHWRVSTTDHQGWAETDFDDTDWDFATNYGRYGVNPWKKRVRGLSSTSSANWIWSANNKDDDLVYFRWVIEW